MQKLRTVDFTKKYFECGGRKFYVRDTLSFARYRELQKTNLEFGFSATFHDIYKNLRVAWDHLNSLKLGDAAITIHNVMYGIIQLDDKEDPALRICALFIDEEGEDPAMFDEGKMREKIDCWGKELDVLPFFQLATNLVPGWMPAYRIVLENGSEKEQAEPIQ